MQIKVNLSELSTRVNALKRAMPQEVFENVLDESFKLSISPAIQAIKSLTPIRSRMTRVKRFQKSKLKTERYTRQPGTLMRSIGMRTVSTRKRKALTTWAGVGALNNRDLSRSGWYAHFHWSAPQMKKKNNFVLRGFEKVKNDIEPRMEHFAEALVNRYFKNLT